MKVIAILTAVSLASGTLSAEATETKARLDRCQAQLSACYEGCKARKVPFNTCNARCSTQLCGLRWKEDYGAFLDRRIEESAAPYTGKHFISLFKIARK